MGWNASVLELERKGGIYKCGMITVRKKKKKRQPHISSKQVALPTTVLF